MKLTILGTGNAMVKKCYNTCFAIENDGEYFLCDAGGGNQILARLEDAGIDFRNIKDIFVTHRHMDHILGIIWLVRLISQSAARGTYDGNVTIYSHSEVIDIIYNMSQMLMSGKALSRISIDGSMNAVRLVKIEDGEKRMILGNHEIEFFDIHSTKAEQYGFRLNLSDGGNDKEYFVCCGDEPLPEACFDASYGAKWFLHEAFCLKSQADIYKPYDKNHSTAYDAAMTASKLNVKNLVLYHTEDDNILTRKDTYSAEAKKCFSGNIFVPNDMEEIIL